MTLGVRRILTAFWLLATIVASLSAAAEEPLVVSVDAVRRELLRQTVPVLGRLVALESGAIAARVEGAVDDVRVQVGDRVTQGQVLAVLDADRLTASRDLRAAELAAAEAAVASARADLALRRQELGRLEGLRRSPAFSEARYLDQRQTVLIAEADLREAEAAVIQARAQLRLAEIALRDSVIRAPYGGVVTRRQADVGAQVREGDPVVTMIDDQRLEIEVDVPAVNVAGLEPGTSMTVRLGEEEATATVRALLPLENAMTRTRTVRLRSDLTGIDDLAANRSVEVAIPVGPPREALTVHKDAILYRSAGTAVFGIAEGKAELRTVRLGIAQAGRFEVVDGLAEGDLVVIRGNERLRPDQAITAVVGSSG